MKLKNEPENTDINLKTHLFTLITSCYKITQRDRPEFKKIGIKLLSQIINLFKNTIERLGDDDSDEDVRKAAQGPLLLEQYEA